MTVAARISYKKGLAAGVPGFYISIRPNPGGKQSKTGNIRSAHESNKQARPR
jgi:hypothetical protein